MVDAQDPEAVLQWRIERKLEREQPPVLTADLHEAKIKSENDDVGYVPDMSPELLHQRNDSIGGAHRALPWMTRVPSHVHRDQPELAQYLYEMNNAIAERASELPDRVATDRPTWAAGLGRRPTELHAAARWDELARLAAAYRETYGITSNNPAEPVGPQSSSAGAKTKAWQDITANWGTVVTASDDDLRVENQHLIDALRDRLQQSPTSESDRRRETVDHLDESMLDETSQNDETITYRLGQ